MTPDITELRRLLAAAQARVAGPPDPFGPCSLTCAHNAEYAVAAANALPALLDALADQAAGLAQAHTRAEVAEMRLLDALADRERVCLAVAGRAERIESARRALREAWEAHDAGAVDGGLLDDLDAALALPAAPAGCDALCLRVAEAVRDEADHACRRLYATTGDGCADEVRDIDLAAIVQRVTGAPVERVWTRSEVLAFGERVLNAQRELGRVLLPGDDEDALGALLDGKDGET